MTAHRRGQILRTGRDPPPAERIRHAALIRGTPAATLTAERNPPRLGIAFRDYLLSAFEKAGVSVAPDRKAAVEALCRELARRVCLDRPLRRPVAVTKLLGVTAAVLHRAFKGTATDDHRLAEVLLSFVRLVLEEGMGLGRPFDIGRPLFREWVVELIRAENAEWLGTALRGVLPAGAVERGAGGGGGGDERRPAGRGGVGEPLSCSRPK